MLVMALGVHFVDDKATLAGACHLSEHLYGGDGVCRERGAHPLPCEGV